MCVQWVVVCVCCAERSVQAAGLATLTNRSRPSAHRWHCDLACDWERHLRVAVRHGQVTGVNGAGECTEQRRTGLPLFVRLSCRPLRSWRTKWTASRVAVPPPSDPPRPCRQVCSHQPATRRQSARLDGSTCGRDDQGNQGVPVRTVASCTKPAVWHDCNRRLCSCQGTWRNPRYQM